MTTLKKIEGINYKTPTPHLHNIRGGGMFCTNILPNNILCINTYKIMGFWQEKLVVFALVE